MEDLNNIANVCGLWETVNPEAEIVQFQACMKYLPKFDPLDHKGSVNKFQIVSLRQDFLTSVV